MIYFVARQKGKETILASIPGVRKKGDALVWEKTNNNAIKLSYNGIERYRGPAKSGVFYYVRSVPE